MILFREMVAALTPMYGRGEAMALARMVLEERYGVTMTEILLGREDGLMPEQKAELHDVVSRLVAGEPVQQILGYADFCGQRFSVTPDVLIPRPETEELVEWVKTDSHIHDSQILEVSSEQARAHDSQCSILDLGTGSGCIAISLALACPESRVTAVDISEAALAVARCNADELAAGDRVRFICGDMLKTDELVYRLGNERYFDIIVSNPPYVRQSEATALHDNVLKYEPSSALFVPDDDPLMFYRVIADIADAVLKPSGSIFMELNCALAEETEAMFHTAGYSNTELRRDQFGRWRMLRASR